MKRTLSILLSLILPVSAVLLFSSCSRVDNEKVRVGTLSGPTGMGMAGLICDTPEGSELYSFEVYTAPTSEISDLAAGRLDMICLPTNTAAALCAKQENYISVIAVNTLGSLFLMSDARYDVSSLTELDGQTVWTSVPGSTTEPILEKLFDHFGVRVTVEVAPDHDALTAMIASGEVAFAVLPEPKVSSALGQNNTYSVDLNLSEVWEESFSSPLAMGCVVVKNEFLKEHPGAVDRFLSDLEKSVAEISDPDKIDSSAQKIVDAGILPKLPLAKSALKKLTSSLVCLRGKEMKTALCDFYAKIAQPLPAEEFYYVPKK